MSFRSLILTAAVASAFSADASWVDYASVDSSAILVHAQDDRGNGKASPICQHHSASAPDYKSFHGLGFLTQDQDGNTICRGSINTPKILWQDGNEWQTTSFRVLPEENISGNERRWTEFSSNDFSRYVEGTFEDGIKAPICQVQHYIDEYENYANFHGLGFVKWDKDQEKYRCFSSKTNKITWQPNGNNMAFSRFSVLKAADPEILSEKPSDTDRHWTFRSLGKPNQQSHSISNEARYEPGTGSYTVALWFYVDDLNGIKKIARKGNATSSDTGWNLFMNGNKVYFRTRSPGFNSDILAHIGHPGWHHFTAVVDADKDRLFAYLNGSPTLVEEGEWTSRLPTNSNISSNESLILTEDFAGNIVTDLRLYRRALNWQEARTLAHKIKLDSATIDVSRTADNSFNIAPATGINANLTHWQLGNGFESFIPNRSVSYDDGGTYQLTLTQLGEADQVYQAIRPVESMTQQNSGPINSAIFRQNDMGYACFRIPSITQAKDGTLFAFIEARTESCEDHHHKIDIAMKRSYDNGRTWRDFTILGENGDYEVQNVSSVYDSIAQRLIIFYSNQAGHSTTTKALRQHMMRYSDDQGDSWTAVKDMTNQVSRRTSSWLYYTDHDGNRIYNSSNAWGGSTATLGHSIQIKNGPHAGRLLFTGYYSKGGSNNYSFFSDDHGESWQIGGLMPENMDHANGHVPSSNRWNEAQSVELENGWVLSSTRDAADDDRQFRMHTISRDSGNSWGSTIEELQLTEPHTPPNIIADTLGINRVCGIAASVLRVTQRGPEDINRLIFSAPASIDNRDRLKIHLSYDEGINWPIEKTLDFGGAAYSDLVLQSNGRVGVMYEKPTQIAGWSTSTMDEIRYSHFDMDWLLSGQEDAVGSKAASIDNTHGHQLLDSPVNFTGSNGLSLGHNSDWNPDQNNFTISYRFKANQTNSSWHYHLSKSSRSDKWGRGWILYHGGGNINFRVRGDNGNEGSEISLPLENIQKWHHVVATINRSSNEIRLYVDGRFIKTSISHQGEKISAGTEGLYIGRHQDESGHQFIGEMSDVRIYNKALSSKAVRALTGNINDQHRIH